MNALLRWAAFALMSLGAFRCGAQVLTWTGAGDNASFMTAANWSPAVVPGPSNDCVIANGSGTIQLNGTVSVRSISTNRSIVASGCFALSITSDLTLNNGATLTLDNGSGCTGLRFLGTSHTIRGNGGVRILSAGFGGGGIQVADNAVLEIDSGTYVRHENGYFGTVVPCKLGAGALLRNRGTFGVGTAGTRLEVTGAATFENLGRCEVQSGSLAINVPWTNAGSFDISGTGSLELGGEASSLGTINRSGGTLALTGVYRGSELAATAATGTIDLKGARLENTTLRSSGDAELRLTDDSTVRDGALMSILHIVNGTLFVEGDLFLSSEARLRGFLSPPSIAVSIGNCSISGTGSLNDPTLTRNAAIAVGSGASLTIGPLIEIPIGANAASRTLTVNVDSGSSLTIDGAIVLSNYCQLNGTINGTFLNRGAVTAADGCQIWLKGTGTFVNEGTVEAGPSSTITLSLAWRNSGSLLSTGATLALKGTFESFGQIDRVGGQLIVGGTHTGGPLTFPASLGPVRFDSFVGNGTRLQTDDGTPLVASGSLTLVQGEIASDLVTIDPSTVPSCIALDITVKSGLRLEHANIRLRSRFACGNSVFFEGGPQLITGTGEFVMEGADSGSTTVLTARTGSDVTIDTGVALRLKSGGVIVSVEEGARLVTSGPIVVEGTNSLLRVTGKGIYENRATIALIAGGLSFDTVSWVNNGQVLLSSGSSLTAGGSFSGLGTVNNSGGTIRLTAVSNMIIEATASTGTITLSGGTYSDVTFRASGGAGFAAASNTSLRRCTLDGAFAFTVSGPQWLDETLTLRNGARYTLASTTGFNGTVVALVGATPRIDGEGELVFDALGSQVLLSIADSATLTIAAGITIGTSPTGTGTAKSQISAGRNAAIVNHGAIVSRRASSTLEILGATGSTLTSRGRLDATDGTLSINVPSWSAPGTLATSGNGIVWMQGTYGTPGSLDRSGGLMLFSGNYLGTSLSTDDFQGDIGLGAITLNAMPIRAGAGRRVVIRGEAALNACTLAGTVVHESCATVTVTNGLTLDGVALSFPTNPLCAGNRRFRFVGGAQSLSGTAQVRFANADFFIESPLTIGPGIEFDVDSGSTRSFSYLRSIGSGSLTNYASCTVRSPLATLEVGGAGFQNLGLLRALAGTLSITCSGNGYGAIDIAPGASLALSGTYSIDSPLSISAGGTLSLAGTWTNNSTITVSGGTLTLAGSWLNNGTIDASDGAFLLAGTWTNNGQFVVNNAAWTIGGTYTSLGSFSGSGIRRTYTGTPPFKSFAADATTGDITFQNARLIDATLEARDGARLFYSGTLGLENCTVAADLTGVGCTSLNVDRDLTLVAGATLLVTGDPSNCSGDGVYVGAFAPAGTFAIRGNGRIVLERRSFDRIFKLAQGTLTISPGIEIDMPPVASTTNTYLLVNPGAKLINQGRMRFRRSGPVRVEGDLRNEGSIELDAGSTTVTGPFVNVNTLRIAPGATALLQGTWSNLGVLTAEGSTVTMSGTWSNTGLFDLRNTQWTVTSGYSSAWGTFTGTGNTLTLSGTVNAPTLRANATTGVITLTNLSAADVRFEASGGASYRIANSATVSLTRCTLAGDAVIGSCGVLVLRERLTLADNAALRIRNTCSSVAISNSGAVTITGRGSILVDTPGSSVFMRVNPGTVTLDPEISLGLDPASVSTASATMSIESSGTLLSRGNVAANTPARSLTISGAGSFSNQGVVRAAGGTLQINCNGLANFLVPSRTLSGGTWIAESGSITLGSRVLSIIGSGTDVRVSGSTASFGPLWSMDQIAGSLRLDGVFVGDNPSSGLLRISGSLHLSPGATLAIGGAVTMVPGAVLRIDAADRTSFGTIAATGPVSLAGHLRGSFVPPFLPGEGERIDSVITGTGISGGFDSICFNANPAGRGVSPQVRTGAPTSLDLVVTSASGTAPAILAQPLDSTAHPDAEFEVTATSLNATYRWQRNGAAISDGPTAVGSILEGTASPRLRIRLAAPGDAGLYRCVVENSCGFATSSPALLTVCPGDLNADAIVDDADFTAFATAYNVLDCSDATMPPRCPSDLNRDGAVNDDDFSIFAVAYDAALCP